MKQFFKKYYKEFLFVAVILASLALIACTVLLFVEYSNELQEQAGTKVSLYNNQMTGALSTSINEYKLNAERSARAIVDRGNVRDAEIMMQNVRDDSEGKFEGNLRYVRYLYVDVADPLRQRQRDIDFGDCEDAFIDAFKGARTISVGIVQSVDAPYVTSPYFVVYVPIETAALATDGGGQVAVEAITFVFSMSALSTFSYDLPRDILDNSRFVALCGTNGTAYDVFPDDNEIIVHHNNVLTVLSKTINNTATVEQVRRQIDLRASAVIPIKSGGESFVIAVGGLGDEGGGICLVSLFRAEEAYSSGYMFVNTILCTLILFFVIAIGLSGYFLATQQQYNRRLNAIGTVHAKLGCPTRVKFERDAAEIIARNKATSFAVIVFEVQHFLYIKENFGENAVDQMLAYVCLVIEKSLQIDETFGYLEDGQFALLLHYRERGVLKGRLRTTRTIISKYNQLRIKNGHSHFTVAVDVGVFEHNSAAEETVSEMVNFAIEAKDAIVRSEDTDSVKFYDAEIHRSYIRNADIEVHMESALQNDEFKIFYQPKYNISKNKPDGSEALVRWYDPDKNEYRPPALFMPLFEANGFITKLDKYIYTKVCEYISECAARHMPLYPVSVNVSRVTAIQPDFIEFYVNTKKKYGIADRFLTIEFTESFAYENYDVMSQIINALHRGGFLCSIDDFGSGYSSYNILKALPMDEIKLDKFFVERGLSPQRDDKILNSVISVAKSLGLKVTQEGVETRDEMERLAKLGCDVIQGYYYSKPLAVSDFESFLERGGALDQPLRRAED
ncbi:MAG: EAL domain-containing protein [Clostridia bacterium]|nr:EAL domain-containing protein [Clostridia bacterium]